MHVAEFMTRRVISVAPTDSVGFAREVLKNNGIHHLLVMQAEKVVGALSVKELAPHHAATKKVSEVMIRDVAAVPGSATVREATSLMMGRGGCLPVVEEGQLRGIITTTDLLRVLSKGVGNAASVN